MDIRWWVAESKSVVRVSNYVCIAANVLDIRGSLRCFANCKHKDTSHGDHHIDSQHKTECPWHS